MRHDTYTSIDRELLEGTLKNELNFPITITEQLPSEKLGFHSLAFFGVYNGEEVVVKLGDTSSAQPYPVQAAIQNFLVEHTLPCPRILLATDPIGQINRPIIVENKVQGESFRDCEVSSHAMEDAGAVLKKMNCIPVDGFGKIVVKAGRLAGELDRWKDFFTKYHRHNEYALKNGFIDQVNFGHIKRLIEELSDTQLSQGYFLHGDYHGAHIFSHNDSVTGVIDYGHAISGDPRYDIAYAHFFLSPDQRKDFNKGYGGASADVGVSKYLPLIAIQKIKARHPRGSKGLQGAQKVLQEILQRENS